MYKLTILFGVVLLSNVLLTTALAAEPGEGTPVPAPFQKASPAARAEGKAMRKEAGTAAVKAGSTTGEGEPIPEAKPKIPKAERQEARAARKAETKRAARAGEIKPTGEVGPQN